MLPPDPFSVSSGDATIECARLIPTNHRVAATVHDRERIDQADAISAAARGLMPIVRCEPV